jgi:adenylate cyclase
MTVTAPTIGNDGLTAGLTSSYLPRSLQGIGVRQIRLACGLVMFSYIFSHFFNHSLGNISYATMEWWLTYHIYWWRIPIVNFVLYTAAATHFSLGLWALYQRRHFRYLTIEMTQLLLGLSIPLWLASHFGTVRVAGFLFGRDPPNYALPLFAYWLTRPHMIFVQFALLTVAWTHASIGLYFWLRLKPFFKWAWPYLLAVAILLPPLAMIGAHHGAREMLQLAADPEWRTLHLERMAPSQRSAIDMVTLFYFPIGYAGAIVLVFAARGVRAFNERRRGMITLSYPDRQVRVPKGMSVLEGSLRHHVPHASVCGGRARCSTCRIRVISDRGVLPPPSGRELHVLHRVGASADPSIRLACQLRPTTDIAFIPILPPFIGADFVRNRTRINIGEERYIVSMFVDMRASTKFAETRLPFDAIFMVNRFLGAVSQAVVEAGGQPNQFIGDGLLALFGLKVDAATACRQAIKAAAMAAANVEHLNYQFATDLADPIQCGIGIHGGDVIIGDIGYRERTVLTALGDSVNVAARLQEMTKSLDCKVVVSEEVYSRAGIVSGELPRTEVAIRTSSDATVLSSLLGQAQDATAAAPA